MSTTARTSTFKSRIEPKQFILGNAKLGGYGIHALPLAKEVSDTRWVRWILSLGLDGHR